MNHLIVTVCRHMDHRLTIGNTYHTWEHCLPGRSLHLNLVDLCTRGRSIPSPLHNNWVRIESPANFLMMLMGCLSVLPYVFNDHWPHFISYDHFELCEITPHASVGVFWGRWQTHWRKNWPPRLYVTVLYLFHSGKFFSINLQNNRLAITRRKKSHGVIITECARCRRTVHNHAVSRFPAAHTFGKQSRNACCWVGALQESTRGRWFNAAW